MLLSNIEMKLNYGYDDVVENEPQNLCKDFLASENDLSFILRVEF